MANEIDTVTDLVAPIVDDLGLELYDVERRSGTIRVTIDTPPGSEGGVDLDTLALATRLISREMDHEDPIPGKYTLEVTSPGLERHLRTARHFQREIGKDITVRLAGHAVRDGEQRRVDGKLVAADGTTATLVLDSGDERVVTIADIDKARTVFNWGPAPKPGGAKNGKQKNAVKNAGAKNSQSKQQSNSKKAKQS